MTNKSFLLLLVCLLGTLSIPAKTKNTETSGYLQVAKYVKPGTGRDVADALQRLIDANPNRTLFLADGEYLLSHPICTPADPRRSVSLVLSNYACLRATADWPQGEAIVRLGGIHPANDIRTPGSLYGIQGGIIDGAGVADGISIDGGRETFIRQLSIKNTRVGIHIKHGANNGSSDADVSNVHIVGCNTPESVGVLVEGFDNTLSDMRIASVNTGVWLRSGGNCLRNIHPLYIFGDKQQYDTSCGFRVDGSENWFYFCYSDQMATGFHLGNNCISQLTDCFCYWYSKNVPFQTAIHSDGPLKSHIKGLNVGGQAAPKHTVLDAPEGGSGTLTNLICTWPKD